jgi:hypothetical protein
MNFNKAKQSLVRLSNNKGIQNLSMKALIKGSFFIFNLYIINTLPIGEIANFALFFTSARFLSFFGSDSMHITHFAEIRDMHLELKLNNDVIDKIKTHLFVSHGLLFLISIVIFNEVKFIVCVNIVAIALTAIRLLADYSRINNTIWKSILIEDLFFTLGFIFFSVVFMQYFDDVILSVTLAVSICGTFTIVYSLLYFKRQLGINFLSLGKFKFNLSKFWFFNKFTLLKGITVFVLYLSRQFGDYYYGEKMVAETHLLIIFINVFTLVSTSIIGAFQNEIVLHNDEVLNRKKFLEIYKKLTLPILYFVFLFGALLMIFAEDFLLLIAPNFAYLKQQFIYTILLVLLYFIVNPIFYFFYMNKRVNNFRSFIITDYLILIAVVISGLVIENYWTWFFALISILIFIPVQVAISGLINLKK